MIKQLLVCQGQDKIEYKDMESLRVISDMIKEYLQPTFTDMMQKALSESDTNSRDCQIFYLCYEVQKTLLSIEFAKENNEFLSVN